MITPYRPENIYNSKIADFQVVNYKIHTWDAIYVYKKHARGAIYIIYKLENGS